MNEWGMVSELFTIRGETITGTQIKFYKQQPWDQKLTNLLILSLPIIPQARVWYEAINNKQGA